jgi:hypothetical protein
VAQRLSVSGIALPQVMQVRISIQNRERPLLLQTY